MIKKTCPCCAGTGEVLYKKNFGEWGSWTEIVACENCRDRRRESIIRQALADPVQAKFVPEKYRNCKFSRGYVWRRK